MSVTIDDKMPRFVIENGNAMDRALNRMVVDIVRLSQAKVPVLHGQLRSSKTFGQTGGLQYYVQYNKVYAAYQEFGGDGNRTVKNYTKAGTGKFYLRDSGEEITKKALDYFKMEARSIKV